MKKLLATLILSAISSSSLMAAVLFPIEDVGVQQTESGFDVTIESRAQLRVRGHSPANTGEIVEIYLEVIAPTAGEGQSLGVWRETNDGFDGAAFEDMSLDGTLGNATLTVEFRTSTAFSVEPADDARGIVLHVVNKAHEDISSVAIINSESNEPGRFLELGDASQEQWDKLDEARSMYIQKNDARASALLEQLVSAPVSRLTPDALELLGMVRERKGQTTQAIKAYRDYVALLEPLESAAKDRSRVEQRIAALISIDKLGTDEPQSLVLRSSKNKEGEWQINGGLTQYYRRADVSINRSGSEFFTGSDNYHAQNDYLTQVDLRARRSGQRWDIESRLVGGYRFDFLDDTDPGRHENDVMLSEASIVAIDTTNDAEYGLGRQYHSGDGVLGRYDGVSVEYPLNEQWQLNFYGGRPVDLTRETSTDNTDRYFGAVGVDWTPEDTDWAFTIFTAMQQIDGMADREAIGGEARYLDKTSHLYTLLDYDYGYSELTTLMLIGSTTIFDDTVVSANLDLRKSPFLSTRNAMIGQGVESIDELRNFYTDAEIRQLALDRTADSRYVALTVTQPLNDQWQTFVSISNFEFGATETSGGVEGFPSTGNEYSYEVQLIANHLFQEYDSHILSLRYYDGTSTSRTSLGMYGRYQLGEHWRLQPRLWVETRDSKTGGSSQLGLRPSLRAMYSPSRNHHWEVQVGRDWTLRDIPRFGEEEFSNDYLYGSYRYDF